MQKNNNLVTIYQPIAVCMRKNKHNDRNEICGIRVATIQFLANDLLAVTRLLNRHECNIIKKPTRGNATIWQSLVYADILEFVSLSTQIFFKDRLPMNDRLLVNMLQRTDTDKVEVLGAKNLPIELLDNDNTVVDVLNETEFTNVYGIYSTEKTKKTPVLLFSYSSNKTVYADIWADYRAYIEELNPDSKLITLQKQHLTTLSRDMLYNIANVNLFGFLSKGATDLYIANADKYNKTGSAKILTAEITDNVMIDTTAKYYAAHKKKLVTLLSMPKVFDNFAAEMSLYNNGKLLLSSSLQKAYDLYVMPPKEIDRYTAAHIQRGNKETKYIVKVIRYEVNNNSYKTYFDVICIFANCKATYKSTDYHSKLFTAYAILAYADNIVASNVMPTSKQVRVRELADNIVSEIRQSTTNRVTPIDFNKAIVVIKSVCKTFDIVTKSGVSQNLVLYI